MSAFLRILARRCREAPSDGAAPPYGPDRFPERADPEQLHRLAERYEGAGLPALADTFRQLEERVRWPEEPLHDESDYRDFPR